jgi:amino acid transporter
VSLLAMYNYGGYNNVCNIAEEIRDPRRTCHARIVISILWSCALYIVMSTVIIGVISVDRGAADARDRVGVHRADVCEPRRGTAARVR